jgi:hypothetical protein
MRAVEGSDDENNDNYDLNVARHAFKCSMRFKRYWHILCMSECWNESICGFVSFRVLLLVCCAGFPTWA